MKTTVGLCVLLLLSGVYSQSATKYSASITPNFYNFSRLSQTQSATLRNWIIWKNKMPRFTFLLDRIADKSFQPQSFTYREGIASIGIFFLILFLISFGFFILVTLCRACKNRCGADYSRLEISRCTKLTPIIWLILGAIVFLVGTIVATYGSLYIYTGWLNSAELLHQQGSSVRDNTNAIIAKINSLNDESNFRGAIGVLSKAGFSYVTAEAKEISEKAEFIADGAISFELTRFVWLWLQIITSFASFALALVGYYGDNKWFLIAGISLLFILFTIMFCHLAYTSSELLLILDVCEQVYGIVRNNIPYTNKGLAYYLMPFTHESKGRILGLLYNTTTAYDNFVAVLNDESELKAAIEPIIVHTYDEFAELMANSAISEGLINKYAIPFQVLTEVIEILYELRYYKYLAKTAQDIEEPLCRKAVNHYPQDFFGVIVLIIGNLIIVVALLRMLTIKNKISTSMNSNE